MYISTRILCLALLLLLPFGCGHRSSLDRKVISGTVTCGGEAVPRGTLRFVPLKGTDGPTTAAIIVNGQYRADNRGGVPLGQHRIEIIARRPTGKKIKTPEGIEYDQLENFGDSQYDGTKSPLIVEVTADCDPRMDFDVPL